MPSYRIKKGKRVFKAAKLATLTELIGRGLLAGDDRVSVDGGPFQRVRELDGVQDALTQKLAEELDSVAVEPIDDTGDGVLAAFLSEVEDAKVGSTTGSVPIQPPADAKPSRRSTPGAPRPGAPVVGTIEREAAVASIAPVPEPIAEPLPEIASGSLEALPPEPSSEPPSKPKLSFVEPASSPGVGPTVSGTGPVVDEKFRKAQARLSAMAAGAGAPSAPVSFADWMADRQDGGGTVLENFGVDDTLVALHQAHSVEKGFSVLRLLLIVVAGLVIVGGWYMWIHTGATQQFPVESSLGHGRQPTHETSDPVPSAPVASPTQSPPSSGDAVAAAALDARLRAAVGDDVRDFNDRDELESALFLELQNLGCRPRSVKTTVLADRHGRPTEVDFLIVQAPVPEGSAQTDDIRERLGLTWMLVGKYGRLGKVTSRKVTVDLAGQLLTERSGDRLVQLHKGATTSRDIFLQE